MCWYPQEWSSAFSPISLPRLGFQSGSGCGLHPETYEPRHLHPVSITHDWCGHGGWGCQRVRAVRWGLVVLPTRRHPGSPVNYCSLASKRKSPCVGLCFVQFSVEREHKHQRVLVCVLLPLHVEDFSFLDELKLTLFSCFLKSLCRAA